MEVREPLQKLTPLKADWTWNRMYQGLYDMAKKIIKKDAYMKFMMNLDPFTWKLMHQV